MPIAQVFGASGAIGRFLVPRLLASGYDVIAMSRAARVSADARVRWVVGDLCANLPVVPSADVVFSLGPLDRFAERLAQGAIAAGRIVAIGSMSVDTKAVSADPAERAVAMRLADAERMIEAASSARGVASTVLRPTLIYGAGLDRSLTPIAHFAMRWRVFPYPAYAGGLRQPVHADDLASACLAVTSADTLEMRVYDLGGGERLAFAAMMERVRASLPMATLRLPVPRSIARLGAGAARALPAFRAAGRAALARLDEDLLADHAAAVADFGWSPRAFQPEPGTWTTPPMP